MLKTQQVQIFDSAVIEVGDIVAFGVTSPTDGGEGREVNQIRKGYVLDVQEAYIDIEDLNEARDDHNVRIWAREVAEDSVRVIKVEIPSFLDIQGGVSQ